MSRRLSALALVLSASLAACSPSDASGETVTVFAAASLTGTFTELGERFEDARPGVEVRFNFGSSAALAQQLVQGAPADVFATASPATMKAVTDASLGAGTPAVFARNRLEIAVPANGPTEVAGPADLADPDVKVALCAEQVPCGAAAAKALDAAGVKVAPVTLEQDVKATLTKLILGEVDAALVYRTDIRASGGRVRGIAFPEAEKAANDYPVVALEKAPSPGLAAEFVELVLSEQARGVFTEAGFDAP